MNPAFLNQGWKVVNVLKEGVFSEYWQPKLEKLLSEISRSSDRLADNYTLENMDLEGHLSFDILIDENEEIVSFAGIYNGGRYPEGVYRILNRTWVSDKIRVSHGNFQFITSTYILPTQLESCHRHLKTIFVSRQNRHGRLFLKKWCARRPASEKWIVSDELIQVVPGVIKKSCFQYICYRNITETKWSPKTITEKEWALLED